MHIPAGTVFADLTVIREVERSGHNRRFICRCVCGKESVKFLGNLRLGRSTSCGCLTKSGEAGRIASLAARLRRAQVTAEGRMCHTCRTWKEWDQFQIDPRRPRGRSSNCVDCARWRRIRRHYGIDRTSWQSIRDGQEGRCGLCGDSADLMIDHEHSCCGYDYGCRDCIRGLLCDFCNRLLGRIEQKPLLARRFADYLQQRPLRQ